MISQFQIHIKMQKGISPKYQLIDDDSTFQLAELEGLLAAKTQKMGKNYHVISIIGSQSSGKSTLLNAVFQTDFDVLNRKKRVGQTTKGIWYCMDQQTSSLILDVEGSDSNEREERTKLERRNSLFALAVSHTLLINIWIQQIGLYKGSQLAILEIILELNLKLFGSEKPKQIIFVVRDYIAEQENKEALKEKLFTKVAQAWENIPKPEGKEHILLKDVFDLKAFFLPSKLEEKETFEAECKVLSKHLVEHGNNADIRNHNIAMDDFPRYMQNIWETIEADKDINLPQEKILLSNMRCHEIKKTIYQQHEQEFRDELEKSERSINLEFAKNIKSVIQKMLSAYDEKTAGYIKEEVEKVRIDFVEEIEKKVELSFSYQARLVIDDCLKLFVEEVNRLFVKDKNISSIQELKPEFINKFAAYLQQIAYLDKWADAEVEKFAAELDETFMHQKEKIIVDALKEFDRSIKKQVESLVSTAFYDKEIFVEKFWTYINDKFAEIEFKAKNSIVSLNNKLDFQKEKGNQKQGSLQGNLIILKYVEDAKKNAKEELKTIIEVKCNDLLYYIMRHFGVEFNLDKEEIPRQWPNLKPEEIEELYKDLKKKYLALIDNFCWLELEESGRGTQMNESKSHQFNRMSYIDTNASKDELLKYSEISSLRKKLSEQMETEYQQALKKNKQVYMGAIPTWAWAIFGLVAFDDILLWLASPYLALPVTLILVLIFVVLFFGGKSYASETINQVRKKMTTALTGLTAQAASSMLKKD